MIYLKITKETKKSGSRQVTLDFETGDKVQFTSMSKGYTHDERSYSRMTINIDQKIHPEELKSELDRMLTREDSSIVFDFLISKESQPAKSE